MLGSYFHYWLMGLAVGLVFRLARELAVLRLFLCKIILEIARIGRYRGPRWGGEQEQARGLVDTDSTKKTYTTQEHSCLPFYPLSSPPLVPVRRADPTCDRHPPTSVPPPTHPGPDHLRQAHPGPRPRRLVCQDRRHDMLGYHLAHPPGRVDHRWHLRAAGTDLFGILGPYRRTRSGKLKRGRVHRQSPLRW